MVELQYRSPSTHYLTINGKYLTANSSVFPSKAIVGSLPAGDNLTDWKITPGLNELAINITVQALGSGASLSLNLLVLDPIESSNGTGGANNTNPPLVTIPIGSKISAAPSTLRVTISRDGTMTLWNPTPTSIGNLPVPFKWQLSLVVTGGSVALVGTFEGRV